jgi:hypothetical protein
MRVHSLFIISAISPLLVVIRQLITSNIRLTEASKDSSQAFATRDESIRNELGDCQKPTGAKTSDANKTTTKGTVLGCWCCGDDLSKEVSVVYADYMCA